MAYVVRIRNQWFYSAMRRRPDLKKIYNSSLSTVFEIPFSADAILIDRWL